MAIKRKAALSDSLSTARVGAKHAGRQLGDSVALSTARVGAKQEPV